jgi:biopolymer transport protein ExbD
MKIRSDSRTRPSQLQGAMTDISFNLIIFLLVAASFAVNQGILMRLPDADTQPRELPPSQALLLELLSDPGSYSVDGTPVREEALAQLLAQAIARKNPQVVVLQIPEEASYGRVIKAMETAKASGARTFSLNGQGEARAVSLEGQAP